MQLCYKWKLDAPFTITPGSGVLPPGQTENCTIFFEPQDAAAFTASAACELDSGEQVIMKVTNQAIQFA